MIGVAPASARNDRVGDQSKHHGTASTAPQSALQSRRGRSNDQLGVVGYGRINHAAKSGHVTLGVAQAQIEMDIALPTRVPESIKDSFARQLDIGRVQILDEIDEKFP